MHYFKTVQDAYTGQEQKVQNQTGQGNNNQDFKKEMERLTLAQPCLLTFAALLVHAPGKLGCILLLPESSVASVVAIFASMYTF